jgi:hypothetical protein
MEKLELARFVGTPSFGEKGVVHDAEEPSPIPAVGVPAADDRTGPAGRTPEELSREFEPSAQAIRNWDRQASRDTGERSDGLTTQEREEERRLRREVKQLREEQATRRSSSGALPT